MNAQMFKGLIRVSAISACLLTATGEAHATGTTIQTPPSFIEVVNSGSLTATSTEGGVVSAGAASAIAFYHGNNPTNAMSSLGSATAEISPSSPNASDALATIGWQFIVLAPGLDTNQVKVDLTGKGEVSVTFSEDLSRQADDYAGFSLTSSAFASVIESQSTKGTNKFSFSPSAFVTPGKVYTVLEQVKAYSIPIAGFGTDTVEADVDPVLSFASGFNSAGYSIEVSPAPAVPESRSAWMMIAGLAGLGIFARQKREVKQ